MFLDTKIHLAFHAFGREIMKVGLFLMSAKLAWREGEGLAELAGKSVFDMTDEEIQVRAKPIAEAARKNAWDHGLPISYRNEICTQEDMIIHEYKGGK